MWRRVALLPPVAAMCSEGASRPGGSASPVGYPGKSTSRAANPWHHLAPKIFRHLGCRADERTAGRGVDEKILAGQQWVNRTYAKVPGYVPCEENGRTGWATINALTMGLQHELGIDPVVPNFGEGTLAALAARPPVGPGEPNPNLCNIVQHGLFAKGYWGGDGDGVFSAVTATSVARMAGDMGVLAPGEKQDVTPKIFRALLSLDAYVVTAGGTEEVRSIQQWLNGRYQDRSTFFLGPCDGHYSRDVQKALMRAIQYELGIPDDQANGSFGPTTQEGLRRNTVAAGSSGIFVQLFSAACVFNELPDLPDVQFTDRFDGGLAAFVPAFQEFAALEVSGAGDYRTWAQLLVSTGDPERGVNGCDTRFTITPDRARALHDAGYRYVGRYLDEPPESTLNKELQPGELEAIFGAGLRVFPIWQYNAREVADFNYSNGFQDGLRAHERAVHYGFNAGTVIYFAVDYDATQEEIDSNVVPYFNGVVAGLLERGKRYVHGVYGSRNVCGEVGRQTDARWSFVSGMSSGFSGNLGFPLPPNWSFNQIKEFDFGGPDFAIDNVAHNAGTDEGQSAVGDPTRPAQPFVDYVQRLYDLAVRYGSPDPSLRVMEYVRSFSYNNPEWTALIGGLDQGFVDFANQNGASLMPTFADPTSGYELGAEHLMATCNGHYLNPQPANPRSINSGDVAGWGGDLMTFYGEWRRDSGSYSSGYAYCSDKLAKVGIDSTFGLSDLLEDADGHLIAASVRAGQSIVDAVRRHYLEGGNLHRITEYFQRRFNGNAEDTMFLARNILTAEGPVISPGRIWLIESTGGVPTLMPAMLPPEKLDEFLRGFVDALLFRAGRENQRSGS